MTVESSLGSAPSPAYKGPDATGLAGPTTADDRGNIKAFDDEDGPSFSDLLDVINPLQHIPVINTIYQHLTGDKEGAVADVVGGALWGGLIGLGAAVANLVVEDTTGKTVGDHVYALFSDDDKDTAVAKGDGNGNQNASAQSGEPASPAATAQSDSVKVFDLNGANQTATAGTNSLPGGGPIVVGNFMVFGGTANDGKTATAPSPTTPAPTPNAATAADAGSVPTQSGDFLVFGAGQAATGAAPSTTSNNATASPQPLTPATQTADMTAAAGQAAGSAATPATGYVSALRHNTTPPRQTLPLPTTGPNAVPGAVRSASTAHGTGDQTDSAWFVGAFNQAMDKYNRAASLGTGTPSPTPTQGTSDGETAASVLRMN
jgi:hypothetical protein